MCPTQNQFQSYNHLASVALSKACENNNYDVAKHALLNGANPNFIESASQTFSITPTLSPLMYAVKNGNTDLALLLLNKGAQINYQSLGFTALHVAAIGDNYQLVKMLILKGADTSTQFAGMTAENMSRERGCLKALYGFRVARAHLQNDNSNEQRPILRFK